MPESKKRTNSEKAWEMYLEVGNGERHFNQLEHQYRLLASTWLLGTFAAIGYTLTNVGAQPGDYLGFYKELIVAAIALAGATGITLIWLLDVRVYQQLLHCFFLEGLDLEDEHEWLPLIRHNMFRTTTQKHGSVLHNVAWFYVGCTGVLLVMWGVSLSLWIVKLVENPVGWVTMVIALGIACAWAYAIRHRSVYGPIANLQLRRHGKGSSTCRDPAPVIIPRVPGAEREQPDNSPETER
jgi:hypothetical protein